MQKEETVGKTVSSSIVNYALLSCVLLIHVDRRENNNINTAVISSPFIILNGKIPVTIIVLSSGAAIAGIFRNRVYAGIITQ